MLPVFRKQNNDFLPAFASTLFDDDFSALFPWNKEWSLTPAVNISENDTQYQIDVAAPGVAKDDFKIHLEHNELTVSCHKESKNEEKSDKSLRKEFSYSNFQRSFILPENAQAEAIEAGYADGVLKITIPKTVKKAAAKQIEIK